MTSPESRRPTAPAPPLDLRLIGPALAAWLGALTATAPRGAQSLLLYVAAAVLVVVTLLVAAVAPGARLFAAATLTCLVGAWAVGTLHQVALGRGTVGRLAEQRAMTEAMGVVTADPRRVAPSVHGVRRSAGLVLVPARLIRLSARGRSWAVRVPVLVLADNRSWADLLPGQPLHLRGRLGPARPGQAVAAVVSVRGPPGRRGSPPLLQRGAGRLREGLRVASAGLPPGARGLLPGLVLGDTSRMPAGLEADFRTAGLTHLTAVSGANLAIVTGFVLLIGRYAGLRGRALPVAAALAMLGFVVLARPQPSVLRAAAMAAVALAALATGRSRRSLAALAATVLALVLVDPWLSRSYGFVLSVLATGALVLLAPGWARAWQDRGAPIVLAQALAVPLAAQLVCAPVVAMLSGQVSLVAVPANLLAAPAVAPATVLGVLATVASAVHPAPAAALAWVAGWFVQWLVLVAERASALPEAAIAWPGSLAGALALAAVLVTAAWVARRVARRPGHAAAAVVLLVVAVGVPATRPGWPPPDWLLAACDVGQGDALVLHTGAGRAVVVDAGPDPEAVDSCLRHLGVERVDVVVLTHLHADHIEGLPGVLRGRSVGEVQIGVYEQPADAVVRVRSWAARSRVALTRAVAGDTSTAGALRWTVLWPRRVIDAGSVANNASVVLLAELAGVRLLLLGDVEAEAQRALLAGGGLAPVDVLKVAHHGSANQAPELLAAVRSQLALVSVGVGNDYGHPAPVTLSALQRDGARVGRTDLDGTVVVAGQRGRLRLVATGR